MPFKCVIYGIGGKTSRVFDTYDKAYDYGLEYVLERDWTAHFDVKETKEKPPMMDPREGSKHAH